MTNGQVRHIRRGHRGNRGKITAYKAGGRAEFESTLERDFYFLLEMDDRVESFQPQPVRIPYETLSGRKTSYVPDALVTYKDGRPPCLFEIKHVEELRDDPSSFRLKFRAARAYCRDQGWTFCTATEKSIRGIQLTNITFLRPYLDQGRHFSATDLAFIREKLVQPMTGEALFMGLPLLRRGELLPALWHLVASGEVRVQLSEPLSLRSQFWRPV